MKHPLKKNNGPGVRKNDLTGKDVIVPGLTEDTGVFTSQDHDNFAGIRRGSRAGKVVRRGRP